MFSPKNAKLFTQETQKQAPHTHPDTLRQEPSNANQVYFYSQFTNHNIHWILWEEGQKTKDVNSV